MRALLPSWFAADQTYNDEDGWYIGSPTGFRVGPYRHRRLAERQSEGLVAKLASCRTTGDRVRVVRSFIHEQNHKEGRGLHNAPPETGPKAPTVQGRIEPPPVRAGESRRVWFRTNRVFAVDDVWFFSTRENIDVGPYATRAEAERDARRLVKILQDTDTETQCRLAIMQFKSRPQFGTGCH